MGPRKLNHVFKSRLDDGQTVGGDHLLQSFREPVASGDQTCIALVTPIIIEGSIVSWVGAGIHLPDMGGPVHEGNVTVIGLGRHRGT